MQLLFHVLVILCEDDERLPCTIDQCAGMSPNELCGRQIPVALLCTFFVLNTTFLGPVVCQTSFARPPDVGEHPQTFHG